jgi:hypothetical protein
MDDLDDLMDVAPLFADTSSGKGGNIFTGHRCTYINCTADGAVSEGDLCVFSTTDWAPNLVRARATGDGFLIIAGVSLDTVSTGLTFRLAIAGSVDARCGNSDTTVSQNAYYKIYGLDAYNMVYTSGGGWQAGVTASPAGTTYSTGWVRIILPR